jgi:hypothetical protein
MPRCRWIGFALVLLVSACGRAASRPPAPLPLPFTVDSQRVDAVARGVWHRFIHAGAGPWAIHVLDVDRGSCLTGVAVKGFPGAVGRKKTSALLAELDSSGTVVGGVNADFFMPNGAPTNLHVSQGHVIVRPGVRPVLAFDSGGRASITTFRAAATGPDSAVAVLLPFHPLEAIGGRPPLVRDSAIIPGLDSAGAASFAAARHPRTAVGLARGGRRLLLVTVDGRQRPYSDGMTLRELATLMLALGARDALNLDGGGSTTMLYKPAGARALVLANHPSDTAGERAVGNALAIVNRCARR